MSSKNIALINSLISAIQGGLLPAQEQDLARKLAADLDEVYTQVNTGPLPPNSGQNLDLTLVPETAFPDKVAFTDKANQFSVTQTIRGIRTSLEMVWDDGIGGIGATKGRVQKANINWTFFSNNLAFDGVNFVSDSGNGAGINFVDSQIGFLQLIGGVLTVPFVIRSDKIIQWNSAVVTGAVAGDMVFTNSMFLRAANAAGTTTLPIFQLDANNLVGLGSNPVGATTGEGNVSIPRAFAADLPAAGATRNGIIIIDKTNNRLCYYSNANRYFIPIGTIF